VAADSLLTLLAKFAVVLQQNRQLSGDEKS